MPSTQPAPSRSWISELHPLGGEIYANVNARAAVPTHAARVSATDQGASTAVNTKQPRPRSAPGLLIAAVLEAA